jgi:ribosomal protein S18 acetylase RimI-like enzyme
MMEQQKFSIREARPGDIDAMLELIMELAVYEKQPEMVTVTREHFLESGFGAAPVWWALLATSSDKDGSSTQIVGMALYYIRYSTWKGQRMYLEDIIVKEAYRGRGIGTLLMDRLIQTARDKNLSGIAWQVLDWNEPAISFYRKYTKDFDGSWLNARLEL